MHIHTFLYIWILDNCIYIDIVVIDCITGKYMWLRKYILTVTNVHITTISRHPCVPRHPRHPLVCPGAIFLCHAPSNARLHHHCVDALSISPVYFVLEFPSAGTTTTTVPGPLLSSRDYCDDHDDDDGGGGVGDGFVTSVYSPWSLLNDHIVDQGSVTGGLRSVSIGQWTVVSDPAIAWD